MMENLDKDFKALNDQITSELAKMSGVNAELTKELAKKAPMERIEELIAKNAAGEISIKKLSDQLDALQLSLKDRSLGQPPSVFDALYKAYKEGKENYHKTKAPHEFELKGNPRMIFKTLDEATELSESVADHEVVLPMRTPGVERLPDRRVLLQDAMARGVTGGTRVTWIERSARVEGTAPVLQDATYALSNFTYIQNFASVEKIGTYVKVTSEALEDWDELLTQINNELFPSLERSLENECYSGTAIAPRMRGINPVAGAYASVGMNLGVLNANNMDAIVAAGNQLEENNYEPNYCFLPPALYNLMSTAKAVGGGSYLLPPFMSNMSINGMKLVKSNLMVAGSILAGDFTKATLYMRRGITIRLWDQDSTDPEFDRKTITASLRAAVKFPTVHQGNTGAFVYDQAADIINAILTV
jgi:HK97 family phage major capsid protein